MAFMDAKSGNDETTQLKAFVYLNPATNHTFPLSYPNKKTVGNSITIQPSSLSMASSFGEYLDGTDKLANDKYTWHD